MSSESWGSQDNCVITDNHVITITGYSGSDTILLPLQQSSLFCSAIHNHQVLWIIENHDYNHRILRIIAKREYFWISLLTAITINHYSHIFAIVSGQLLQHMRIYYSPSLYKSFLHIITTTCNIVTTTFMGHRCTFL